MRNVHSVIKMKPCNIMFIKIFTKFLTVAISGDNGTVLSDLLRMSNCYMYINGLCAKTPCNIIDL